MSVAFKMGVWAMLNHESGRLEFFCVYCQEGAGRTHLGSEPAPLAPLHPAKRVASPATILVSLVCYACIPGMKDWQRKDLQEINLEDFWKILANEHEAPTSDA